MDECLLHGFTGASRKACCGMVHPVYRAHHHQVDTFAQMLTSKTRVAHLKELSISRHELMVALVLLKLMVNVEGALALQQSVNHLKLWLDSQTALFWIMNRG